MFDASKKMMKIKGDMKMNVNYEHKDELTFIGFHTEIAPDEGYKKCPEFWDKEYNEKYANLWQTMKPKTPVEEAILENNIGMYAICADGENVFSYWIAGLYKGGDVPDGLELFTFPESDWAIFSAKGPLPESLQAVNTQVWEEWAPSIEKMYEIAPSSLETYSAMNPQSPDYECGIWVPIKKKADLKICQSCGMPMESEEMYGTNADGSISEDYCKYCYMNGEFIDKVSMEEYIGMCSQFGSQAGMTNEEMKAYCEKLFPTLKRWKKAD